jgi:hypothetical protein
MLAGNDLAVAAKYMRALADDLDRIAAGGAPTAAELAAAPVIDRWRPELSEHDEPAVSGIVSGDRFHADGERLRLEIVAADPDLAWIRALLGFYRVGVPESEFQASGCGGR